MNELLELNNKYLKVKKLRAISIPIMIVLIIVAIVSSVLVFYYTQQAESFLLLLLIIVAIIIGVVVNQRYNSLSQLLYAKLEKSILNAMGLSKWSYIKKNDVRVEVKSRKAMDNYNYLKFFKENREKLDDAIETVKRKQKYGEKLTEFLANNKYKSFALYYLIEEQIKQNLKHINEYCINIVYVSSQIQNYSERIIANRVIWVSLGLLLGLQSDKSLLMSKSEYNKYLKDNERELLEKKQHDYYEKVNCIIDLANDNKDKLIIKNDVEELDKQINALFDRTVNSIKKVKTINSEEWGLIDKFIANTQEAVSGIIQQNKRIVDYYNSLEFKKVKSSCDMLMNSQKEFNEYIDEKVKAISDLFGTRIVRNETNIEDEYNYIHPYKKSINPFVAEVSSNVFASAENNPLDYVVKSFYPDKARYPEQIQKLQLLIEELETLKEAKQIIENYKKDVQQYLANVPSFVMENDEDGFYSRLGFATINESVLTVEYKFCYTSGGGHAQRSFTVPMTEETIVSLINALESKLTMSAFSKEQRSLMTSRLRQHIKERDNYTCKCCGNSVYKEPNLLLEIDHIIPVSKGGVTEENNLQTLCWKCNRQKSSKIIIN